MKILFVASANKLGQVGTVVNNQAESLKKYVDFDLFLINGKGFVGYIKSAFYLCRYLKKNSVDVIHAHYILSGWVAVLGSRRVPVILSLMGSDTHGFYVAPNKIKLSSRYLTLLTYLIQPFVRKIISKSENLSRYVWIKKKSIIIPNGVSLGKYYLTKERFHKELGLDISKKSILFLGDKDDINKNYQLFHEVQTKIGNSKVEFVAPFPVDSNYVPKYLNSVNLFVLTSLAEGSPNVIKEAMCCNCPIVATDVGDIRWLFGDEPGHYIVNFDPTDVAKKIMLGLEYSEKYGRTNGRKRIIDLGLDAETITKRIICIYEEIRSNSHKLNFF